jgi:hypothetical protein
VGKLEVLVGNLGEEERREGVLGGYEGRVYLVG